MRPLALFLFPLFAGCDMGHAFMLPFMLLILFGLLSGLEGGDR